MRSVVVVLLAAALTAPAPLTAQTGLERGRDALRSGRYAEAVRALQPAAGEGAMPARVEAARLLAEAHAATGAYDRALAALDRAAAADRSAASAMAGELGAVRGRILRRAGRHREAGSAFEAAIAAGASDVLVARLGRAELLWDRGHRERAFGEMDRFIDAYNQGQARDVASLTAVAVAVSYLGLRDPALLHDAVRAFDEAIAADPAALEPRVRLGELFLSKYDGSEAQALLAEALERNPRHADALVAMARAKRFEGSPEAMQRVDEALEVNPRHVGALTTRALLLLEQGGDEDGALADVERALALDSTAIRALAVRAAARFLASDSAAYARDRGRALAVDPTGGGFDVVVAEIAVRRAYYRQAVDMARRAAELDPLAWDAWSILGMNQLRIADVEGARRSLERAFEGDPFNPWTKNTLDLLDRLDGFRTVRTERFELVMDPAEAELLGPYVAEVAEEAYETLSRRYGYRPETPVRVEIYPRHADFSVRTMGLPGLGALGVAFGRVLAMDSPSAREPGAFHWASTLWHEIAHAVTLGMTGHHVPRWLTEGISVREERRSRPGWGGGPSLDFLLALHRDMLLPMSRIDEGFIRPAYPGQVAVSYQHASWIVHLIERDHGEDAVRRMLERYARGDDTGTVFRAVLGTELDDFDEAFRRYVRERFAGALLAVAGLEDDRDGAEGAAHAGPPGRLDPSGGVDRATAVQRARARPDHFRLQLAAGTFLAREGREDEAIPFLERARELFPEYAAPGSPYHLLARIHRDRGDIAGARRELTLLVALDETALAANLELAELLEGARPAERAAALERAVFIHPYDPSTHERLADAAAALGRTALELRERKAVLALRPTDRAGALFRLALAHRRAGDLPAARRAVLESLEAAPDFADAQELLLDLSGGG